MEDYKQEFINWLNADTSRKKNLLHWEDFLNLINESVEEPCNLFRPNLSDKHVLKWYLEKNDNLLEYYEVLTKWGKYKFDSNPPDFEVQQYFFGIRELYDPAEPYVLKKFKEIEKELTTTKQKETDKTRKIEHLEKWLTHQLSWKTKIKQAVIWGLLVLGGQKTYHYYQGESNLTSPSVNLVNYNNYTWLDNIYLNIPFNEPEYKNLTNLLKLPQEEKAQKSLDKITDLLFSDFSSNSPDLETELARLKITDLITQIPNKKSELKKIITETKIKLNKAENYLLEQLLTENLASEKLTELKAVLSDHSTEIELILVRQQEIKDSERHLERLQDNQLEAKIEVNNK